MKLIIRERVDVEVIVTIDDEAETSLEEIKMKAFIVAADVQHKCLESTRGNRIDTPDGWHVEKFDAWGNVYDRELMLSLLKE